MTDDIEPPVLPDVTIKPPKGRRPSHHLPRGDQIWLRCTSEERTRWENEARRLGMYVSAWVRMMLNTHQDRKL